MKKSIIRNQYVTPKKVERSRELRQFMTGAEKEFWEMVRGRKLFGLKFRRQQVIDGFVIDFYCNSLNLCVEIDGDIHVQKEQFEYDRSRDRYLEQSGFKVIRFTNKEVLNNKEKIIEKIKELI